MSLIICLLMITSISDSITQNAGQSKIIGQPTLSSSGSGGPADSPWPMFRQNLNHTGLSPYDTSLNPGKFKWNLLTDDDIYSSPAIGLDGTIYIGSLDNNLYAINSDGTEKWNFTTRNGIYSSPTIDSEGTIYVISLDRNLYAINPDGTLKWNYTFGDPISENSPTIGFDGTIYFGTDYKLYAVNLDGTLKWTFPSSGSISFRSTPAIGSDGTVYIGSRDHKLYAINPDGTLKWSYLTPDRVNSSPAIGSDGTIYVGSNDDKLHAINPDGTGKWSFMTGWDVPSSPAIGSDETIYIGSLDQKLYAINSDGTQKWNFTTGGSVHSSPAIGSDGTIFVGSLDYKVYAINPDGIEKWNYWTGRQVFSSPAIDYDGTIYVGSYDNKLHAIGIPSVDISVEKTANVTSAKPGDIIEYTIYYNNTGPDYATTVLISELLPSEVTFITSSDEINRTGDYNWTYYNVNPGNYSLKITIQLNDTIPNGTILTNFIHLDYTDSRDYPMPRSWDYVDVMISFDAPEKQPPIAVAGFNQIVDEGNIVHFNGTGSYVPYGIIDSYEWDFDSDVDSDGDGDPTNDVDANSSTPTHIYGDDGVYNVKLTVRASVEGSTLIRRAIDIVFVIDSSTSMSWNDPNYLRLIESQNFITKHLELPDRAAVIDFDLDAILVPQANPDGDHLHTNYARIIDNLGLIDNDGPTLLYQGMNLSNEEIRQNSNPNHKPVIILLTDAEDVEKNLYDFQNSYKEAYISASHGIIVFTIGLNIPSESQSEQLLKDIANITGGKYFPAPDPSYFEEIYEEISEIIENQTTKQLFDTDYIQVSVRNAVPKLEPSGPYDVVEDLLVTFIFNISDIGSDDLTFTYDWGDGTIPTTITYYNDGINPEPTYNPSTNKIKSPDGIYPFNITNILQHIYNDAGVYKITLTIEDDDGGFVEYGIYVQVRRSNEPPLIESINYSAFINKPRTIGYWGHQCEVEEPYGDHIGILQEWIDNISFQSQIFSGISTINDVEDIVQSGDASDMMVMAKRQLMGVWLNIVSGKLHLESEINMPNLTSSKTLSEILLEIENVMLTSNNRSELEKMKDISDNINNGIGIANAYVEFVAIVTDPDPDNLTFHWNFGDGKWTENYYPNVNGSFPVNITDHVVHSYFSTGSFTVTLTVTDDDGEIATAFMNIDLS